MADQIEPPGLIGGKADRDIAGCQKSRQPGRKADVDTPGFCGSGRPGISGDISVFRRDGFEAFRTHPVFAHNIAPARQSALAGDLSINVHERKDLNADVRRFRLARSAN